MPKIIIGYYDNSHSRGGTTRYLQELIGGLNRERFKPVFFTEKRQTWHEDLIAMGVKIITTDTSILPNEKEISFSSSINISKKRKNIILPKSIAWTIGLIKELRLLTLLFRISPVDILHLNNTGAEPSPIAARIAGVPCIIGTWHVDSTYDLENARSSMRFRLLERISMHSLHHSISVSKSTKDDWVKRCSLNTEYSKERVTVIYNGIDILRITRKRTKEEAKESFNIDKNTIVIGSIGRLAREKGFEFLIHAISEINNHKHNMKFIIAGAGPLEKSLKELSVKLGVSSLIHFEGFTNDVSSFLEALDIYIQPSLCEALGIATIEACCMGLPAIVSEVGGLPELVVDGTTGIVIPPSNPTAIAQAIISLAGDLDKQDAMGKQGQVRSRQLFNRERMIKETVNVYEKILLNKQSKLGKKIWK